MNYITRGTQKKHKDFMIADQRPDEDMYFIYLKNNDIIIKMLFIYNKI